MFSFKWRFWQQYSIKIICIPIRACERSGAWSERGAERAKYSRSAERVFIQRPERSLCLAPVPLRYRSHHESRACTNPPVNSPVPSTINKTVSLHFKNRSLWRRDGVREIFPKANRQVIQVHNSCQKMDDNDVEHDQECGDTIAVSKDSYFNLKIHIMRKHDSVLREHGEARAKREHFEYGWNRKYWLIIN